MKSMILGKYYRDGDVIMRQDELGNCMYVIQEGQVELRRRKGNKEFCITLLGSGEFFGEDGLLEQDAVRTATASAVGDTCVLSIEKRAFLARIHEDPSFVVKMLRRLSRRVRDLEVTLVNVAAGEASPDSVLSATGSANSAQSGG